MDAEREFVIYCHTHIASGKRYVGQTRYGMQRRWISHLAEAKRGARGRFANALRKYGRAAFSHDVLEELDTRREANEAEQWWIAHFGSTDKALGYNIEAGGDAKNQHPETKSKLRRAALARWAGMGEAERKGFATPWRATMAARTTEQRAETSRRCRDGQRRCQVGVTFAERSERAKAHWARKTPEERRRIAIVRDAACTAEERRARGRKGGAACAARPAAAKAETARKIGEATRRIIAGLSPEARREIAAKSAATWAAKTPAERSGPAVAREAAKTPEQRTEEHAKRVATGKANRETERTRREAAQRAAAPFAHGAVRLLITQAGGNRLAKLHAWRNGRPIFWPHGDGSLATKCEDGWRFNCRACDAPRLLRVLATVPGLTSKAGRTILAAQIAGGKRLRPGTSS